VIFSLHHLDKANDCEFDLQLFTLVFLMALLNKGACE